MVGGVWKELNQAQTGVNLMEKEGEYFNSQFNVFHIVLNIKTYFSMSGCGMYD